MPDQKIEPRLAQEIERVESAGQPERAIPVIIEHVQALTIPTGGSARGQLAALDRQVSHLQAGIVARLSELGSTGELHQATLANALSTSLTPAQIRQIAAHGDVKLIRLNREEQVTA